MGDGDDAAAHVAQVRQYYDRNSVRFQRLGHGGAAMHRAVWAPGVATQAGAFTYVEEAVLRLLADVPAPRVVDLGCGVGASLQYLARRRADLRGDGVTISPEQAKMASALITQAGLAERVRIREGDFLTPPADLGGADLAFSIEAFVHGPDPAGYLRSAAGMLRPGGLLVVCDDLLTPSGATATPRLAPRLDTFRRGWRVASLVTVEHLAELAATAGLTLTDDRDLTPYLQLRRPRDRAIGVFVAATRRFPRRSDYWWSLAGGDALQRCLAADLIAYRLLTFRQEPDPALVGSGT